MDFQIANRVGEVIPIGLLDQEAAKFWNKEHNEDEYVNPSPIVRNNSKDITDIVYAVLNEQLDWYIVIGWSIAISRKSVENPWKTVLRQMIQPVLAECFLQHNIETIGMHKVTKARSRYSIPDELGKHIIDLQNYYQPYINLINYWKDKGYVPVLE